VLTEERARVNILYKDRKPMATTQPRTQLKDEAAAHIRELIVSGQVAPGQLLRLAPLAERVGASITPVREALLLLTQDGWVTQEPNRGFRVLEITRKDVEDAYLVQSFICGELAARAAVAITPEQIAALRALDADINAHDDGDQGYLERKNYELHDLIYEAAESERLVWFVRSASRFVPRRFWGMIPGWVEHNRSGHSPVIDALEAHDPVAARATMAAHIGFAGSLLLHHLESIAFWPSERPS
jgi:DNA-binding GntR family transcriptional regulator